MARMPIGDHGGAGGKLLAAHRALRGTGPLTDEQMICRVVDEFNCTPTEAINELRTNPMIIRLLETRTYTRTYEAVDRWTSMSDKQRAHATAPSGPAAHGARPQAHEAPLG